MSPWLLNIFIEMCMREIEAKVKSVGASLKINGMGSAIVA